MMSTQPSLTRLARSVVCASNGDVTRSLLSALRGERVRIETDQSNSNCGVTYVMAYSY